MKAYELLSDRSKWTQESIARNKENKGVPWDDPEAVCWCLVGALSICYQDNRYYTQWNRIHEKLGNNASLGRYNDTHTYEEIIELLKELDI